MTNKTHYRKAFKSDHLGVADLEEFIEEKKPLVFTIKNVTQHVLEAGNKESGVVVAGNRISANIAHFKENIKPWKLNVKATDKLKEFTNSPFVEDWSNIMVELYIDPSVKYMGEIVGGVRIKPNQPTLAKPELKPENKKIWDNAVVYLKGKGTIEGVKKSWSMSTTNEQKLKDAAI
jgi:hypothetical protein